MAHRWLTPLLCLSVVIASAQPRPITDSLVNRLFTAVGKDKVRLLSSLCKELSPYDSKRSIEYGKQAITLAEKVRDESGLAQALLRLAQSYRVINDQQHRLSLLLKALSIYHQRKDVAGQALTLELLGQTYLDLGGYPEALERFLQSLELYHQAGKPSKAALVLGNIGHLYAAEQNDSNAIRYLRQSLALLEAQPQKNFGDLTLAANDIGLQYKAAGQFDQAMTYLNKAAAYCRQIPLPYRTHAEAMVLTNLGSLQESRRDYEKALEYNRQSLVLAQRANNHILIGLSYKNRGRIYSLNGEYFRSIESYLEADTVFREAHVADQVVETSIALANNYFLVGNYPMANAYGEKALKIATRDHQPALAQKALHDQVRIFEASGDFKRALAFQKRYQTVRDTLLSREKIDQISKLQVLFDVNRKQEAIKLLEMTREKGRAIRYVLCAGILLLTIIGTLIYRQQRMLIRKDRMIHSSQQTLMQVQLTNTRMQEEQLRTELQGKNKELTTYALNFIQKNQLLAELKQKIRTLKKEADGPAGPELSRLQYMISHSFNLDKDWDDFRIYFEQVHHRFFQELRTRFKDLTTKELRLCALMKLNLSSKEIATILGISANSVKMARYRMRKKIGLGSEADLTCFMINFEKQLEERSIT